MPEANGQMEEPDFVLATGPTTAVQADPVLEQLSRWRADNERNNWTSGADSDGYPDPNPPEAVDIGSSPPHGLEPMDFTQERRSAPSPPLRRSTDPLPDSHLRADAAQVPSRVGRHEAPTAPLRKLNGHVRPRPEAPSNTRQATPQAPLTTRRAPTAPPPPPAIEATNLHKRFKDMVAVHDVSFTVPTGSIVALLGPNGAGKTTTVNMLCTLLKPDGGHAVVAGHDVSKDAASVRRAIMLTGQFAALDESLTGRENLILFGRLLGLKKAEAKVRADELLDHFSLVNAGGKRVGQYSGGMRRRIDIACGLVTSPKVVFLDEPTTGLDPRSRQDVWSLVERLKETGVTTLLTTQYLEEADMLSDNIVVIDRGRVIAEGSSDELKSRTGAAYCDVTPEHAAERPRLMAVLADLLPADLTQPNELRVCVPAPNGADTLVEVVRRTTEARLRLADLTMRRPSLDEVFLNLTDPDKNRT